MDKKEAINYLRKNQGFSKRLSTKIVDIAFLQKSYKPTFGIAFEEALKKCEKKRKENKEI